MLKIKRQLLMRACLIGRARLGVAGLAGWGRMGVGMAGRVGCAGVWQGWMDEVGGRMGQGGRVSVQDGGTGRAGWRVGDLMARRSNKLV